MPVVVVIVMWYMVVGIAFTIGEIGYAAFHSLRSGEIISGLLTGIVFCFLCNLWVRVFILACQPSKWKEAGPDI
jgi:hypothetical protein